MAIPELDPREYDVVDANVGLDMTITMQHHSDTFAQLITEGTAITVFERSILPEQTDEVRSWIISGSYVPGQAVARSLNILMVATEAPPVRGGIARTVGYLRDGFQERGHHVDVLAYPGVGRLVFGEVRLSSLIFKLPQLLRRIDEYDVIDIHGATPTISDVALLFARHRDPHPIVIYTHHMELVFRSGGFLNRAYNHLHHRLSDRADVVIAETLDTLRLLGNRCKGVVVPPGIDLEYFSTNGQKDMQFTVLFIGQFRPYKGVRVLLQAMSQVMGARLLLAGQGPEEQAYRSLAVELGLNVEFHIGVDDDQLRQLYQRAHAVVLPSISHAEAFGLTLVEGMAAGCVPIASDLPGVREVVGQTGFLFPAGDSKHLAALLCDLRDDLALVKQIGDRVRVRAAEFGRERTICKYESLITGLIACRNLRGRLAGQARSCGLTLHAFMRDIARELEADWTEIVLGPIQDELYSVASMGPMTLFDHHQFQRASFLLAQHAIYTGESTLVGPNTGPLHLRNVVVHKMLTAMVTPLIVDEEHFGALISIRKQPFDQFDLSSFRHLAINAAPLLHTLVKAARVKEDK